MKQDDADAFDPLHGRAYNSTRSEIQKIWRALRSEGCDREAAVVRDPGLLKREDFNLDLEHPGGIGTPNQLQIARELARQHLPDRQIEDIRQGRLRW